MLKKGPWTAAEDAMLMEYVRKHGEGNWNAVQKNSALARCGKSCRLRWANHLRPNLKKGSFSPEEERLILHLHSQLGNKWARMAAQESQALVGSSNSKRQKLDLQENQQSGLVSNVQIVTTQWDDLSSVHSSKGLETKEEPVDQINSIHADLSTFFDIIPTDTWVPQWYGDSGEISNGQSSAVTDDNVGFEMQQLSSPSLQLGSTSGHEWTLSPCSWSSTPGVC